MVAQGRNTGAQGAARARRRRTSGALDPAELAALLNGATEQSEAGQCEYPGCTEAGDYRAPRDRTLGSYFHFCLEHVRAYNKAWNYCAGMTEDEIEAHVRTSTIWDRPTWRVGVRGHGPRGLNPEQFADPLGIFAGQRAAREQAERDAASPFPRDSKESRAMGELGLAWPVDRAELKTRYRLLVKRFHPDANGGDKQAEERFKRVSEAYRVLLAVVTA
jgi:hypothetical protein